MIKKDGGTYARGTVNYNTTPEYKRDMWEQIVEAAKVVIERGGGDIKFRPPEEDSERMYRDQVRAKRLRERLLKGE